MDNLLVEALSSNGVVVQEIDENKFELTTLTSAKDVTKIHGIKVHNSTLSTKFCPHCNIAFNTYDMFQQHNQEMHERPKLSNCPLCDAAFRRQDHLKRHIQSRHTNQKYCICPVCGEEFNRQDVLTKHLNSKHAYGPNIYKCRDCAREHSSLTDLLKHESEHTQHTNHVCPHCSSNFKRRDHMLRHVKSQHLNQFVTCPICSLNYKRKDHLVRHVREKHHMGFLNGQLFKAADVVGNTS